MKRKEEQESIKGLEVEMTHPLGEIISDHVPLADELQQMRQEIAALKAAQQSFNQVAVAPPRDLTPRTVQAPAIHDQTLQARRAKNNRLIKGKFRDFEVPGGTIAFSAGPFLKGDVTKQYRLTDGEVYELPAIVVQHLNEGCFSVEYKHKPGADFVAGVNPDFLQSLDIEKKIYRFGFQPVDFGFFTEQGPAPELYLAKAL